MISPKPTIIPQKPERPARTPKRMTIAIGMLCDEGLIIAADTQITNPDGTTYDKVKIKTQRAASGTFVMAWTAMDMYPAEMLIENILAGLNLSDPKTLGEVEDIVKSEMLSWSAGFAANQERPYTAFILGAQVQGISINPDRMGMYFCEPPAIMLRQTMENSKGYIAIGAGLVVTDPLFRTLFGNLVPARVCLAQISYLMHRAKKDCRGACGGGTDAVLLRTSNLEPAWIEGMMSAEQKYGAALDATLSRLTAKIMSRNGFDDKSRFADFLDRKSARGTFGLYGFTFHTRSGEPIREPDFQRMMDDPEKYLEP